MSLLGSSTTSDYIPWDIALSKVYDIKNSKPILASIIATGINTGLRISDITNIKVNQLGENITIIEKKTKKPRKLMLNPWLLSFLKERYLPTSGYLFSKDGSSPLTTQYINRELKVIFSDLDINISSHSLRKTFGRRVMEQNNYSAAGLLLLMDTFNHSSLAMTKVYLGIRQDEINEIYLNIM